MVSATSTLAGRYRLESPIATGGVGEVWRGRDEVLGRPVAVKLLRAGYAGHPETLARFQAEARHAASLSHPGIAQVYDYGEDGQPFLVMELVDGPSLAAVLRQGPLPPGAAMDVVAQTAAALASAHAAGLVHRDVKPGNLLLGPGQQVKVTDFGIAHAAGSAPLTRTGTLVGTPAYLAPERVAGQGATPASDLYSLGIVGYECLSGVPPFTGAPVEVALAHHRGELPPLGPAVPAEMAALVASLTAKDPAARPASAAEVARWAAGLRDTPAAAQPGGWQAVAPAGPAPPLPATLLGGPTLAGQPAILADAHTTVQLPAQAPLARGRRLGGGTGRGRLLVLAAAAAVAAVLAVWLAAGGRGAAGPAQSSAGSASAGAAQLVRVSQQALAGQPVSAVRSQLRQLGLQVRVVWQHNGDRQPGTVLSVQPAGLVPAGTTVVLTGAAAPPGHGDGGGHGNGDGNGQGGGNGG